MGKPSGPGIFSLFVYLTLFYGIAHGLLGVLSEQVFSLFHPTTARWVYGQEAIWHGWLHVGVACGLLFLKIYFDFFRKLKSKKIK